MSGLLHLGVLVGPCRAWKEMGRYQREEGTRRTDEGTLVGMIPIGHWLLDVMVVVCYDEVEHGADGMGPGDRLDAG